MGALRYQSALPDLSDPGYIAYYNHPEQTFQVEGTLLEPPDVRDRYTNLRLHASRIQPLEGGVEHAVDGKLLVTDWDLGDWRYGDVLRLQGILEDPPEGESFSYRQYLNRQGIYSTMQPDEIELLGDGGGNPFLAGVYALKQRALDTLYLIYPDPEASLLAGILLGVESGIPEAVERAFQDSGTAHIVAISGFNIAILAGLFAALFGRLLGRWRGAVVALACITVYTVLVGAGASVVRAALMGGLTLLAAQLGRRQEGLNTLAFVAALMALLNPHVLWDVGFQLSFMATLGLVLYAGLLTTAFLAAVGNRVSCRDRPEALPPGGRIPAVHLRRHADHLACHRLPLPPPVAGLHTGQPVHPARPAATDGLGWSFTSGRHGLPCRWGRHWLCSHGRSRFTACGSPSCSPGSRVQSLALGEVSLWWVVCFYAVLFGLTFFGGRLRLWAASQGGGSWVSTALPGIALAGLGIAAVLVWRAAAHAPDGRLHLTVLDVGSGDALLVQTPSGRFLLVDGGPSPSRLSDALGRRLPLGGTSWTGWWWRPPAMSSWEPCRR